MPRKTKTSDKRPAAEVPDKKDAAKEATALAAKEAADKARAELAAAEVAAKTPPEPSGAVKETEEARKARLDRVTSWQQQMAGAGRKPDAAPVTGPNTAGMDPEQARLVRWRHEYKAQKAREAREQQ